jgi:hypothetical protein
MTTIAQLDTVPEAETGLEITGGVDTHRDTHTAAAIDQTGRMLGHATFPTTVAGYAALLAWLRSFGLVVLVGVEGTGAYGTGLTCYLTGQGVAVVEIDRPNRKPAGRPASPTRSTPKPPPAPRSAESAPAPPRPATATSKRSATCGSPAPAPSASAPAASARSRP